jgi:hypothetical protein
VSEAFNFKIDQLPADQSQQLDEMSDRAIQIYRNPDGTTRMIFMFKVDLTDEERDALIQEAAGLFDDRQFESLVSNPYRVTNWRTNVMGAIARLLEATPLDLIRIFQCLKNPPTIHKEVPSGK